MAPQKKIRLDSVLDRGKACLFKSSYLGASTLHVSEFGQHRSSPQVERLHQPARRIWGVEYLKGYSTASHETVKAGDIERLFGHLERISSASCDDPVVSEHPAKARYVNLKPIPRWQALASPDIFEEAFGGNRVSLCECHCNQHRPWSKAPDVGRIAVVAQYDQRTENA